MLLMVLLLSLKVLLLLTVLLVLSVFESSGLVELLKNITNDVIFVAQIVAVVFQLMVSYELNDN